MCLAHVVLSGMYASVIPYRQPGFSQGQFLPDIGAPDERAHANLVQRLIDGRGYPRFDKDSPTFGEDYQAHQPPAYYVGTALVAKAFGIRSVEEPRAGPVMRGLNIGFGAVNILGIFFLVRWLGRGARQALTAAAVAAVVPMNCALSGSVSNDVLMFACVTWSLAFAVRAASNGWNWKDVAACSVIGGVALLTKTSALVLLPVLGLVGFWSRDLRRHLPQSVVLVVVPLLIAAPWWGRNQAEYGDPLMSRTFFESFPHSYKVSQLRNPVSSYRFFQRLAERTIESSTGVFGYTDIHYPKAAFTTAPGIVVWVFGAVGLMSVWFAGMKKSLALSLVFVALVVAAFVSFNLTYMQPQARYIFPALPFFAWWVAEGLCLVRDRWTGIWVGVYLALNIFTLQYLVPEFGTRLADGQKYLRDQGR